MKPVIAVNCDLTDRPRRRAVLNESYIDSLARAGGVPLLLPPTDDAEAVDLLLDRADGLLLTGGDDLDPSRWTEPRHPRTEVMDPRRERSDFLVLARADGRRLPILGICCGLQLINIHRGGSLVQDIPDLVGTAVRHRGTAEAPAEHEIEVVAETRLSRILGAPRLAVNSAHHQAVRRVGRGLRVTAQAPDGVIEGLEEADPARFLLAVQWHPERIVERPAQLELFRALVEAASVADEPEVTEIPW